MNIEEARENIGAEVLLDQSTKPYTSADGSYGSEFARTIEENKAFKICGTSGGNVRITKRVRNCSIDVLIKAKHLKLKQENYKIHVPTKEESREAQELFFELGYKWNIRGKNIFHTESPFLYAHTKGKTLNFGESEIYFENKDMREVNLQDLRDMALRKKYESHVKPIEKSEVVSMDEKDSITKADGNVKSDIEVMRSTKTIGAIQNFRSREEMSWEDALRVVVDGGDVESTEFYSLKEWLESQLRHIDSFRISPKRVKLNGEYTKEELLKKIEDM